MLVTVALQGSRGVFGVVAAGLLGRDGSGGYDMGNVFGKELLLALWEGNVSLG